jgi:hypothetical protein
VYYHPNLSERSSINKQSSEKYNTIRVCNMHVKGKCKNGDDCRYLHIGAKADRSPTTVTTPPAMVAVAIASPIATAAVPPPLAAVPTADLLDELQRRIDSLQSNDARLHGQCTAAIQTISWLKRKPL